MAIDLAQLQVASGHSPRLARRDPADRLGLTGKAAAREQRDAMLDELEGLHGRLWAEAERSVLLVLQGVDTSGKDGVIRRALSGLNPQGCAVTSFKTPTTLELERDYLWRVHDACPARGRLGVFNRSHYEDVVTARVLGIIDDDHCRRRFRHVREFEQMLTDEGTIVVKVYLHISREEQRGATPAASGAARRPDQAMEVQARGPRSTQAVGCVSIGVRGGDRRDVYGRRAVVDRARRPEVGT